MRSLWGSIAAAGLCLLWGAVALAAHTRVTQATPDEDPNGAAIYLRGLLSSGSPLEAQREGAPPLTGSQAACVNCHRPSGLGYKEARSTIPPVTGAFLFGAAAGASRETLPYVPGARLNRAPYTDESFARALRDGIDSEGRHLSYLMPRYALSDMDLEALAAHLRSLDHPREPGVSDTELHFATILTPDVPAERRAAVRLIVEQYFEDRNGALRGPGAQSMMTSGNTAYAKMMFHVNRRWVLHVWELQGAPESWTGQLQKYFKTDPVFAVISGIAGTHWPVVAAFCESQRVPCLFPNVEAPPADADSQFHTIYFSRGVGLEADLIAGAMLDTPGGVRPARVLQIFRPDDVGVGGAGTLAARLQAEGVEVAARKVESTHALGAALADATHADAVVLWLRPSDLRTAQLPAGRGLVYVSGLMAGLEEASLPEAWRARVRMAYPVDLPISRRVRLDYAHAWFRLRHISVIDDRLQADTYLACGLLSETLKHMVDAFVPDYLVESIEETVEHRLLTGYYPRLSLAPKQRFASKGGYMVHFEPANGPQRVVADGGWVTP